MITTVTRVYTFEAAHQLPAEFGGPATRLHGHSYTVRVECEEGYPTEKLDKIWRGMLGNFDHRLLNETFPDDTTVEGLSVALFDRLDTKSVPVVSVEVQEGALRFGRTVR